MKFLILNGSPKKKGATAKIVEICSEYLSKKHQVEHICLGDKTIQYCLGCKACYNKGECIQEDDVASIVQSITASDVVLIVVPSYWAEVPGQMKVFIDRCTPYSNTNPTRKRSLPHTKGYAIALRTGPSPAECEGILKSIAHYYGHMEIEEKGSSFFCGIDDVKDIEQQRERILLLCQEWFGELGEKNDENVND